MWCLDFRGCKSMQISQSRGGGTSSELIRIGGARYVRARVTQFARHAIKRWGYYFYIAVICTSTYIVVARFETHAAATTHIPSS